MLTTFPVQKRINYKAILALIGILVLLGTAVHFVHAFQVKRNAADLREQAMLVEKEGKIKEAMDFWGQYVGMMPEDIDALARYGMLLDNTANAPAARLRPFFFFEKVLRSEPQRDDIRRRLTEIAMQVGRIPDAKVHLKILLDAKPGDAELLQRMAGCLVREQKAEEALEWYDKALAQDSKRRGVFLDYARVLRDLKRPEQADAKIEAMVHANEALPEARIEAARYYLGYKVWDQAEKHARAAMDDLHSQDPEVFLLAAAAAFSMDKKQEASDYIERGEKLHPDNAQIAQARARWDLARGDVKKARQRIEQGPLAKTPAPSAVGELYDMAELLIDLGQPDKAREMIKRYRDKGAPGAAEFLEARLAMQLGNWAEARRLLNGILTRRQPRRDLAQRINLQLAKCYHELSNFDQELEECNKALLNNPQWPEGRAALGDCLAAMGKLDGAIQEYERAAAGPTPVPGARLKLARLLLARNLRRPPEEQKWDEVEKTLQGIPSDQASQAAVLLLRADILVAQKKYDDARRLVEAARDRDPKQLVPWMSLVILAQIQGQTDKSRQLIDQAERDTGKRAEWTLARLRLDYRQDKMEEFKKLLQQVERELSQYPQNERPRLLLGLADDYLGVGDREAALRLWRQAAESLPQDLLVRFRLFEEAALVQAREAEAKRWLDEIKRLEGPGGAMAEYGEAALLVMRARQGDKSVLTRARQHLEETARLRPSWSRVPLLQATILELENQHDKALEKYQAALDRGESRLNVIRHVVLLYRAKGRFTEANALLKKLPDETLALAGLKRLVPELGLLDPEAGKNQDPAAVRAHALDLARKAVSEKTGDYQDYWWLGLIAGAAGQPAEAEQALRKALVLKPDGADAWTALISLLARSDKAKAEAELQNAKKALPKDQSPVVLAAGYEALGNKQLAEENYEAALKARPNDVVLLRNAAAFYARYGESAKVIALLTKMLEPATGASDTMVAWARRTLAVTLAAGGNYNQFQQAQALLDANHKQFGDTEEDKRTGALVLATQPKYRGEAIKQFEALSSKRDMPPETRFLLAYLYEANGNWQAAKWKLQALVRDHDNNPVFLARLATLLLQHKLPDEAFPYIERLAKLEPKRFETVQLMARALKAKGRMDEALDEARKFARAGNPPELAAALFEELGDQREAENYLRAYVKAADRPERELVLAAFLGRINRTDEALELCDKAWEKCTPEAVAVTLVTLLRSSQPTEAQERQVDNRLRDAIMNNPTKRVLLLLRAEFRASCGHADEAIELYRELLRQEPSNVAALNNLAVLLALREGQTEEALRLINKAIDLGGPGASLLDTRAMVYLSARQPELAIKDLDEAIQQAPLPLFYFHQARAYVLTRDRRHALQCWQKAQEGGLTAAGLPRLERPTFESLSRQMGGF